MSQSPEGVVWTQIWQIAAVVCAVAVVVRVAARHRPYLSHALWLVVLAKCITPPVFCSPAGVFCWMRPSAVDSPAAVADLRRPANDANNRPAPQVLSARVRTERHSLADLLADERRTPNHAADTRPMLAPDEIEPAASPSMTRLALRILGVVWIAGTLVIFVGTSAWLVIGLRRLRRDGCRVDPALQRLATSLARRLGLRRRVRLIVTTGRVGPAVFGLVRPTVLLPEAIVQGRPTDELEPILANELIHIRRGDLWVGLLQTVAQAVWWFHPGVWLVGRWICRDAERCCDEAVVAELRCPPSRYARSLLEVLARKRDLTPLPSLPGVRPVELTSKRMERIMRLGQGCRGRSPWWCWAVMLLTAAAVLPGAASSGLAEKPSRDENPSRDREGAESNDEPKPLLSPVGESAPDATRPVAPPAAAPRITFECEAADLVRAMREEFGLDEAEARKRLEAALSNTAMAAGVTPAWPTDVKRVDFAWTGDRLVMTLPKCAYRHVTEAIDTMRRRGLSQITLEVRFVTAPSDVVDAAGVDWTSQFEPVSPERAAESPHRAEPAVHSEPADASDRSRTVREKSYPVRIAKINRKDLASFTARLGELESQQYGQRETLGDRVQHALGYQTRTAAGRQRVKVLETPAVTLFEGQTGMLADCSRSPFVVDLKSVTGPYGVAHQPVIRVFEEGTKVQVRAVSLDRNSTMLQCRAQFSRLGKVETLTTKSTAGSQPVTIQVPEHETTELVTNVRVAVGQTVVVDGPRVRNDHGRLVSSLVLVTPSKVVLARTTLAKIAAAEAECRAYNVVKEITDEDQPALDEFYREQSYSGVRLASAEQRTPRRKSRRTGDSKEAYVTRTYHVGDLVVPIPGIVGPLYAASAWRDDDSVGGSIGRAPRQGDATPAPKPTNAKPHFESLVELITATIEPESWSEFGGRGTVKSREGDLSLTICQTKEVHEEIVDLLAQLRRMNDVQVMLDVRRIDMAGDTFDKLGIELDAKHRQTTLGPREARLLWALANSPGQGRVLRFPRVTCFNGQQATFGIVENPMAYGGWWGKMNVHPVVNSGDRARVRLTTEFVREFGGSTMFLGDTPPPTTLPDGQTLLVDVTGLTAAKPLLDGEVGIPIKPGSKIFKSVKPDTSAQRVFLSITPKVIIAVEEEERITPKPQPKSADSRKPARAYETETDLGMVKPRVIIQEEEEERLGRGVEP